MNANQIKFRASSMSDIMSGVAKKWNVENSLTCKRKLVKIYREMMWKRKDSKGNQYTEKGIAVEEDSITLYSRVTKKMWNKNVERVEDDYFSGELDLYIGADIKSAEVVVDIKSSWDWTTFPSLLDKDNKDYFAQIQTYLALTGAQKGIVAYCLVNTPADMILQLKQKAQWKVSAIDVDNSPEYIEICKEIEKNCIVDRELFEQHYPFFDFHIPKEEWEFDIPKEERVLEIAFDRDEEYIRSMQGRVLECRSWMNTALFKTNA